MRRLRRKLNRAERGIALLLVLVFLALIGSVVADFQFTSHVDYRLAVNARDELQAEYNAMSALRLRALLLKNAKQFDPILNDPGLKAVAGGMIPPIAQILDAIPVECGVMSSVLREAEGSFGKDEDEVEDFFVGECMATSQSEHSKISINMLRRATGGSATKVQNLLLGLLSDPMMERHFQEDDKNGTHAENPLELVGAITDWVDDNDTQAQNAVADEERHYQFLDDAYRPKNAPFDSVAELQMVHGIDDELYEMLKDRVTVHADNTQIELATADEFTMLLGFAASLHDGMTLAALQTPQMQVFMRDLAEMRMIGMATGILNVAGLAGMIQGAGLDAFIDTNKVKQVFTDKTGGTWYTIDATGRVGNASRRIRAVFQAREGRFYYVRIE